MQGEKSLIESAILVLENEKKPLDLYELFDRVTAEAGLSEAGKKEAITKFYTDLTISAKFMYVGNNEWNLKVSEKIELWEKDGSFYKEYTVVELPDEYKEAPKPKNPKKLTKAAKAKLEKAEAAEAAKVEAELAEAAKVEAELAEAAKVVIVEEPVVKVDTVVSPVINADGTPVVEPVAGAVADGTEEENVFQEYDEFDEEKYNEYMDTYEDQYKD
jgi:DNA-directed RNA polymerase subunit delta